MDPLLSKISLIVHISAGVTTLVAGPIAIFYNFKNVKRHRQAGKVFFYAMLVVCLTAWLAYFKHPDVVFFQFLLGIATLVFAGIMRGVRAIYFMKNLRRPGAFDWSYTILLGIFAVWMLSRAAWHFSHDTMIAFPILFAVFGAMSLSDTWENVRLFRRPELVERLTWYRLHVSTMLGAFTASTTAFTVNAANFLPWYLQWFGPTLLIVPLQIYFGRKLKRQQRRAPEVSVG